MTKKPNNQPSLNALLSMNVEYLKGTIRVFSGAIRTENGRRVD